MKICVYAISKNEEQFVERFCKSAADADLILIADTGSTDQTVAKAKECGADVHNIFISPWRFDHARNAALALVPADIDVCVSLDLDEVLNTGWREEIERVWKDGTTRLRYMYDWGKGLIFKYEKIHARKGYEWHHPCHEYPRPVVGVEESWADTNLLLVSHYPDDTKSRASYLPLLELSVKEDPRCPRNAFYYARELYFHSQYWAAITALENYLAMPEANWSVERGYAYRVMGKCYEAVGMPVQAESAFLRACAEDASIRCPWYALAGFYYRRGDWFGCWNAAKRALSISVRNMDYTVETDAWGAPLHDLAAIAAHHLGMRDAAIFHGGEAVKLSPDDQRLKNNLEFYVGDAFVPEAA